MKKNMFSLLAGVIGLTIANAYSQISWQKPYFPYRLQIQLASPAEGKVRLSITPQAVLDELNKISVDQMDIETLAFEKAELVDSKSGRTVGGYRIISDGKPLYIDGQFDRLAASAQSPWKNLPKTHTSFKTGNDGKKELCITNDVLKNQSMKQTVKLRPGQLYLLNYRIYLDTEDGVTQPQLIDPKLRIFNQVYHSYCSSVLPQKKWISKSVLYLPRAEFAELQIFTGFKGTAAFSDISIQPVSLALEADLTQPADKLELYGVCRAGHRLPSPEYFPQPSSDVDVRLIDVANAKAQRQELNPDGIMREDSGVTIWSIPSEFPLRGRSIQASMPSQNRQTKPLTNWVARGGKTSVLLAVRTDTPQADIKADTDLSLKTRIERIAEIPLFDGAFGYGKQFDIAYDAIVPLDYPYCPPSSLGTHIVLLTVEADAQTSPGLKKGTLNIAIQSNDKKSSFSIPLEINVLSPIIEPTRHFAAMFAGHHFTVRYFKGRGPFTKDSTTVAEYHGFPSKGLEPTTVLSITMPDDVSPKFSSIKDLAWKYFNRLLDFDILSQAPTIYAPFSYDIKETPTGKPVLSNWKFDEYDKAIEEFLVRRNATWFGVNHTNGHQMHKFRLRNGVTYSFESAPKNVNPKTWRRISREDYMNMVADYFDAIAAHLDEKGLAERGIIVIDESDPSTYQLMRDYVFAIKSRPHAKKFKTLHTTYKPSTYTMHAKDGSELILDGVLDIPAPDNDDHFNFFEPQANARLKKVSNQWVYYVETDHFCLDQTGISTMITPLKLKKFGAEGWYCWAAFIWDMPYPKTEVSGLKYPSGPVINPWINPFYHHGNGVLSFFYPPVPSGPSAKPTDLIIPSYRLALMRDGIEYRALLETLASGRDDAGNRLPVDSQNLKRLKTLLDELFPVNPVQWYLSYHTIAEAKVLLSRMAEKTNQMPGNRLKSYRWFWGIFDCSMNFPVDFARSWFS